jgi:putative membrane protein
VSPIDELAARAFSIHMIQHEMLMVVAAPLLATSRPLEAWAWALPAFIQRALVRITGAGSIHHLWRQLTRPVSAWSLHALSIWIWHIPALFAAALANEAIHVLQHTSFLASALLFWSVTTRDGWRVRGAKTVAMLFTTMLHTGALGLLLTFSPTAWYVQQASELIGLSALEDQQLGGLIMWVPGGFTYMLAALWIVYGWLTPPVAVSARNTR